MRRLASKAVTNAGPLLSNSAKSSAKMPCSNCGTFSMSTILGRKEATRHKSASTVWPVAPVDVATAFAAMSCELLASVPARTQVHNVYHQTINRMYPSRPSPAVPCAHNRAKCEKCGADIPALQCHGRHFQHATIGRVPKCYCIYAVGIQHAECLHSVAIRVCVAICSRVPCDMHVGACQRACVCV